MRTLLLLITITGISACGGTPLRSDELTRGDFGEVKPLPNPGEFYTNGIADYASAVALPPNRIEDELRFALHPTLALPPSLHCYAREYAARFGADGQEPDPETAQNIAHHCGFWARPATHYSVTAPNYDALVKHVRTLPKAAFEGVVAVGVAPHPDGAISASLVTPQNRVRLAPIPRTGPALLTGRLLTGDGDVELWISDVEGPRRLTIDIDLTGNFSVALPETPIGRRVELTKRTGRFRETIALLHLGATRDDAAVKLPSLVSSPSAASTEILHRVNALRRHRQLPEVTLEERLGSRLDDWLSRVASKTAEDTPPGILDENGWHYPRLEYGLTSGADAAQAVALLVNTPTGERLLLDPSMTTLSLGMRKFERGDGFDAVLLMLAPFEQLSTARVRETIQTQINAQRETAGLKPLSSAPELDRLAQTRAEAVLASGSPWNSAVDGLLKDVASVGLVSGAFGGGGMTVIRPEEAIFQPGDAALNPSVNWIGIGTVGGPMPGGGQPRYILLYVVSEGQGVEG